MHFFSFLTIAAFGFTASASPVPHGPMPRGLEPSNGTTTTTPFPFSYTEANVNSLAAVLDWIDSVPDAVVSSGLETVKGWSKDHDYNTWHNPHLAPRSRSPPSRRDDRIAEREEEGLVERQNWIQIGNCVFQITKAIAEGLIPVAKLRRVKVLIEEAGGVYKAAKALLKADKWEDLKEFGEALYELATVLAGVDGIADACFNIF